jgi:hypothetical protein
MGPLIERLRSLLQAEFINSRNELETVRPSKVGGFLIWDGFDGLDPLERQNRMWKVLREGLEREDQLKITAIFALTPAEWSARHSSHSVQTDKSKETLHA